MQQSFHSRLRTADRLFLRYIARRTHDYDRVDPRQAPNLPQLLVGVAAELTRRLDTIGITSPMSSITLDLSKTLRSRVLCDGEPFTDEHFHQLLSSITRDVPALQFAPPHARLPRYCGVTQLQLGGNGLAYVPEWICEMAALQELHLQNNALTSLPECIGDLAALHVLDASNNQLEGLPESLCHLQRLQQLTLHNNNIAALPEHIGSLASLMHLQLEQNALTSLPDSVGSLTCLMECYVGHNELSALPDSVGRLTCLHTLELSYNPLAALPDTFCDMHALASLFASHTLLTRLPDRFGDLSALSTCVVSHNQLQVLPHSLSAMTSLARLDVSFNGLTHLPHLAGTSIAQLDVQNNMLTSLPRLSHVDERTVFVTAGGNRDLVVVPAALCLQHVRLVVDAAAAATAVVGKRMVSTSQSVVTELYSQHSDDPIPEQAVVAALSRVAAVLPLRELVLRQLMACKSDAVCAASFDVLPVPLQSTLLRPVDRCDYCRLPMADVHVEIVGRVAASHNRTAMHWVLCSRNCAAAVLEEAYDVPLF